MNLVSYVVMQEAKTRVVEVDVVDSSALQRTLSYLCTDVYDDETLPLIDYVAAETNNLQHTPDDGTLEAGQCKLNESVVEKVDAFVSMPQSDAQTTQTEIEDITQSEQLSPPVSAVDEDDADCCTQRKDERKSVCNNTKLQANTLVYILADYCQISELKRLAMKKFAAVLEEICPKDFGDICHLVYEVAPPSAHDLRLCLSNAIASHGQQLVQDASFMETTLSLPQLLRDVFSSTRDSHQVDLADLSAMKLPLPATSMPRPHRQLVF